MAKHGQLEPTHQDIDFIWHTQTLGSEYLSPNHLDLNKSIESISRSNQLGSSNLPREFKLSLEANRKDEPLDTKEIDHHLRINTLKIEDPSPSSKTLGSNQHEKGSPVLLRENLEATVDPTEFSLTY